MVLIKDLNLEQIKIIISEKKKYDKEYPKIFKKINRVCQDFGEIKKKSKDREDFKNQTNLIIFKEKNKSNSTMLKILQNYYYYELYSSGINFLKLIHENNEYQLRSVTKGFIKSSPKNVLFMLRAARTEFNVDFPSINPLAYSKFEKYMLENLDVMNWFNDFIVLLNNSFSENQRKLADYINMIYEDLTNENKRIFIEKIRNDDPDFIITLVKHLPSIWTGFIEVIEEYANKKIIGSKEKPHDYISREILNNTISSKSVNDMIVRHYKKQREEKKAISNRLLN